MEFVIVLLFISKVLVLYLVNNLCEDLLVINSLVRLFSVLGISSLFNFCLLEGDVEVFFCLRSDCNWFN